MGTHCIPPCFYYTHTHTLPQSSEILQVIRANHRAFTLGVAGRRAGWEQHGRRTDRFWKSLGVAARWPPCIQSLTVHQQPQRQCSDRRLSATLCASSCQMVTPVVLSKGFLAARNVKGGGGRRSREWSRLSDKLNSTGTVSVNLGGGDGWRGWWKQRHLPSQPTVNF